MTSRVARMHEFHFHAEDPAPHRTVTTSAAEEPTRPSWLALMGLIAAAGLGGLLAFNYIAEPSLAATPAEPTLSDRWQPDEHFGLTSAARALRQLSRAEVVPVGESTAAAAPSVAAAPAARDAVGGLASKSDTPTEGSDNPY